MEKADSTLGSSQAVPHPSTNRALCRLTSEVRRDPVYSTRYGRQRYCRFFPPHQRKSKPTQVDKQNLESCSSTNSGRNPPYPARGSRHWGIQPIMATAWPLLEALAGEAFLNFCFLGSGRREGQPRNTHYRLGWGWGWAGNCSQGFLRKGFCTCFWCSSSRGCCVFRMLAVNRKWKKLTAP